MCNVGRYCVYLLAAGWRIAYAGTSGRVEERLRRHFKGYSSAAGRGLRPDAAYVLACTRSKSLALAWGDVATHRPPHAARAPAKRPRKPLHPGGTPHGPRSTGRPARRPADTAPLTRRRSSSQDVGRVRDVGPNSRARRACPRVLSKRLCIHRHSSVSKLCPATWAYLQVQTYRYFLTGVIRPVSLCLWGSTYVRGCGGLRGEVKLLQFIIHSGIYHGHG